MVYSSKRFQNLQMSRVILVLRSGADANYILSELEMFEGVEVRIVLESGKVARKKKLKRMLKGSLFHKIYVVTLQIPLLIVYDRCLNFLMFRGYILSKSNCNFECFRVNDVNEEEFIAFVKNFEPKIVLSFGTAIYSSATLSQISSPVLNLHTGILPKYRNVHTDFWAYVKNDLAGIGVTLFELTEGIDDGPVIREVRSADTEDDYLWNIKLKNLSAVLALIQNAIQELNTLHLSFDSKAKDCANQNQNNPLWPTPTAWDLIKYLKLETSKVVRKHSIFN
jgi:folate-dependent phosphoribosylglycinamide formyltransferase PurN